MRATLKFIAIIGLGLVMSPVYANDGSLVIETDIHSDSDKQEVLYVEQEDDLAALFHQDLSASVAVKKSQESEANDSHKGELFLADIPATDDFAAYEDLLFTAGTRFRGVSSYHIKMMEKPFVWSWQLIGLIGLGLFATSISLYRVFTSKKG